jgi:hypothetical protein
MHIESALWVLFLGTEIEQICTGKMSGYTYLVIWWERVSIHLGGIVLSCLRKCKEVKSEMTFQQQLLIFLHFNSVEYGKPSI